MVGDTYRQVLLLEERCIEQEVRALIIEVQLAGEMIGSAKTAQARVDSTVYTEQVLDEITVLERKLYAVQAKRLALSGAEPGKPLPR